MLRAGLLAAVGAASTCFAAAPSATYFDTSGSISAASESSRRVVSRLLGRLGVLSIRGAGAEPTENDFTLTAGILGMACELDPSNLDMLRRQIDAWHGAGRRDRVAELTARLVELDPQDSVAQLRLLSSRINDLQTAQERIAAYDRIMGPGGAALDPAVRSRLALDAALLARETGDEEGFVQRLTRATQLDSTNKDAAALAASLVLERDPDALARAEALLNVVLADPMDASSHANLGRELRNAGAFGVAQRFQDNADAIYAADGRYFDLAITYERLLTLWGSSGPEALVNALDDRERALRKNRADEIAAYQAVGREPPQGPAPEQVTLEPSLEVLRAAGNIALKRTSRIETTARLMTQQAQQVQQVIQQATQQGADPAQIEEASERLKLVLTELLWLRLWAGVQINDAEALLNSMRDSSLLTDPVAVTRYEGLVALHRGDYAAAEAKLSSILNADPRARIGMAMLEEARGNTRRAAANLAPLALEQTGSMLGLYARSTIERLLGQPIAPAQAASRLREYFASVPRWLDDMTRDPREFMVMDASWPERAMGAIEGLTLNIRLRNLGRVPLPVGPNLTVNSRLLLSPDVTIGGQSPEARLAPEVAEFGRALRVMPGESTRITVQSDIGAVGAVLDNAATQVATLRWQIAQGFLVDQGGAFYRGPTSVSTTSPLMTRRRLSIPDESPNGVRRALNGAQGDRVLEVLYVLRDLAIRSIALEDRQAATELTAAILETIAGAMPRMNELERAASVVLVSSVYPRNFRTPIDQVALEDESLLVRTVAAVSRVNDAADPVFDSVIEQGPEAIDELMNALRTRLRIAAEFQAQQQRMQQQQQQRAPQQGPGGLRYDPTK